METCLATLFSGVAMARPSPVVSVCKKFQYLQVFFMFHLNFLLDCQKQKQLSVDWCKKEMEKYGRESAQRDCSARSV